MKIFGNKLLKTSFILCMVSPLTSYATVVQDVADLTVRVDTLVALATDAATISVEKNCGVNEACFTTITSALDWAYNNRNPSPGKASPLVINIGVGTFDENITCDSAKHITFNGAGIKRTTINKAIFVSCKHITISNMSINSPVTTLGTTGADVDPERGMSFENSKNITANNLSINTIGIGIHWSITSGNAGTNISNWTNIHVTGGAYGWFDSSTGCGTHNYFASTFTALGRRDGSSSAFYSGCADNWIFGSQLVVKASQDTVNNKIIGIDVPEGEAHVYGSNIRVLGDASTSTNTLIGAWAKNGGEIHLHGTGIDVIGEGDDDVTGLLTDSNSLSLIHASESAYVLKTGTAGSRTRINNDNGGDIKAPHVWSEQGTPPDIISVTGADMIVITDTSDNQPHLAIYSDNCPSKWYDTVDSVCVP